MHITANGVDHGWWGGLLLVYAIVGGVDHMSHAPKMVQPWRTPKVACTKNARALRFVKKTIKDVALAQLSHLL